MPMFISLQQYLPFTVLKPKIWSFLWIILLALQQYLPFTVLKLNEISIDKPVFIVAIALTVYGIETNNFLVHNKPLSCCNSIYRLRYWNHTILFKRLIYSFVAIALTIYGIETVQILVWNNSWLFLLQQHFLFTVYGKNSIIW